jgi:hypothetical protein
MGRGCSDKRVEYLTVEQLVAEVTSSPSLALIASATGQLCAVGMFTCRILATILSAVCRLLAFSHPLAGATPYLEEGHFSGGRPL